MRSCWTLIEGSFEDSLERTLFFLRTKQEPRACEGPVCAGMKPPVPQMGSVMYHRESQQETEDTPSWVIEGS